MDFNEFAKDWKISNAGNAYKCINNYFYVISNRVDHDSNRTESKYHIVACKRGSDTYFPIGNLQNCINVTDAKKRLYNELFGRKRKKDFEI